MGSAEAILEQANMARIEHLDTIAEISLERDMNWQEAKGVLGEANARLTGLEPAPETSYLNLAYTAMLARLIPRESYGATEGRRLVLWLEAKPLLYEPITQAELGKVISPEAITSTTTSPGVPEPLART